MVERSHNFSWHVFFFMGFTSCTSFIISKAHVALRIADDSSSVPGFLEGKRHVCILLEVEHFQNADHDSEVLKAVDSDPPRRTSTIANASAAGWPRTLASWSRFYRRYWYCEEISTHAEHVVILICQCINIINIHVSIKANNILETYKEELIQTCQIQSFDTV